MHRATAAAHTCASPACQAGLRGAMCTAKTHSLITTGQDRSTSSDQPLYNINNCECPCRPAPTNGQSVQRAATDARHPRGLSASRYTHKHNQHRTAACSLQSPARGGHELANGTDLTCCTPGCPFHQGKLFETSSGEQLTPDSDSDRNINTDKLWRRWGAEQAGCRSGATPCRWHPEAAGQGGVHA